MSNVARGPTGSSDVGGPGRRESVIRVNVRPGHIMQAASASRQALDGFAGSDWTVPAGDLEWDVRQTIVHPAGTDHRDAVGAPDSIAKAVRIPDLAEIADAADVRSRDVEVARRGAVVTTAVV